MQCVILAGGLGTRMGSYTQSRPKAMIPVMGIPFIDLLLDDLQKKGVTHAILSIGYKGDILRSHLEGKSFQQMRIEYVDEGPNLLGTGGALRLICDSVADLQDAFFVTFGDAYLALDMADMWRQAERQPAPVTMSIFRNQGAWGQSNVAFKDGRLLYDKQRRLSDQARFQFIDYGMSIIRKDILMQEIASGSKADIADVIHRLSLRGAVNGYEVSHRFYEIGSPDGLADFSAHIRAQGVVV